MTPTPFISSPQHNPSSPKIQSPKMTTLSSTQIFLSSLSPTKISSTHLPPTHTLFLSPSRTTPSLSLRQKRALPIITNAKGNPTGEQKWTHEGSVTESLPNGMFRVKLDNEDLIIGYISGKIRKNFVRILPGDRVKVEVSRYDSSRGRIVYRLRNRDSGGD